MPQTTHAIPEKYLDLFEKRAFASLGTLMPDGRPQVTPVWVDFDGEHVIFNSAKGRQKDKNVRRDPRVAIALIPALVLIVGVLGSIFAGVASPTEAASVGAAGGLILTMVKGRFSMSMLRAVMQATTRITSLAFIILVGANCFGLVFRGLNGDHLIQDFLKGLPFGAYGVLAVVMFVIFVLGFFIDFFEICFIHVPILTPVLVSHFGFDPVWLGVVIGVNLQTSFLTPPFGFALFYLRGVAPPEITTPHIYRGVVPFVALQLIGLTLVIAFPDLASWLIRALR